MKKLSLFALAAAGLLLGACSDKDTVNEVVKAPEFTDGAFIGVTLQLPSAQNSTRANEDYDDGETDEFAVKNATLYIFRGTSEDAATYVGQYVIGTTFESDGGTTKDNVTSTYNEATQISNELAAEMSDATNTDNYYAYVIVNNPGVNADATGLTFAQFRYLEWDKLGTPTAEQENISEDTGLLMTNAPVCDTKGGTEAAPINAANYSTLVKLDKTKVFSTAAAAKAAPAGCIFIERAAVKITVAVKDGLTVATTDAPKISFEGWQIINYPEKFYNTRKVDPAWGALASDAAEADFTLWAGVKPTNEYRFVSYKPFHPYLPEPHDGPYRTYFAEDATYTTDGGLLRPQAVEDPTKWIAMDKRGFTTENTFDVEHQTWKNTTQVTFKTTLKKGETAADFYTINGGDVMYDATGAKNKVQSGVSGVPAVLTAINDIIEALIAKDKVANTDENAKFGYTIALTVAFGEEDTNGDIQTVTTPSASANNVPLVFNFTVTAKDDSQYGKDDVTEELANALLDAAATAAQNFVVSYYKGGVTYYTARIQHFGEYETPWSASKPFSTVAPGTTVQQIYGFGQTMNGTTDEGKDNSAARFLGRYGVVRDNWYKLSVDAVNHIGTAEPVDVSGDDGNTPDDEIENYISVHVHIVPWVLRNQSVNF